MDYLRRLAQVEGEVHVEVDGAATVVAGAEPFLIVGAIAGG